MITIRQKYQAQRDIARMSTIELRTALRRDHLDEPELIAMVQAELRTRARLGR